MTLKRVLRYFNIAVLVLLLVAAGFVYWYGWRPLPKVSGSLDAPVSAPVEIGRDSLGVPHVSASSVEDALFAQGYATAQDRLWQMDALRRLAEGRLAEVLGPRMLESDREARRFRIDRIAETSVATLSAADRLPLAAYARGVNWFIETNRSRLPLEFSLLGYSPRPWSTKDSVAIGLYLYRKLTITWKDKLQEAAMLEGGDPAKVRALFPSRMTEKPGAGKPGTDGSVHAQNTLGTESSVPGFSNCWAIAGARTASGRPVLASDPHLEYSLPGIWHMVHLKAPGLDVSGVALPGVPGVLIGHNDRIAWGMTNLGFDVEDLYIERIDLATGRYFYRGQIEQARLDRELIPVKGAAPVEFAQWVTRHGPVFIDQGRALALRWAAAEPGAFAFPILDLDRARNWSEFRAALARYPGPGQNVIYADVDGNIGYQATGRLPIRRTYDGDVPVDGASGDYEWDGFIPFDQLPTAYNPPSGMIVSANQDPFPADYPYRVRGNFAPPYRVRQIRALLEGRRGWRAWDMLRIQKDVYSSFSRFLAKETVAAWDRSGNRDASLANAIAILRGWNGQMEKGTAAPLVTALLYEHLKATVANRASPGKAVLYHSLEGAAYQMAPAVVESLLRRRPASWFSDYDQLLMSELADAVAEGRRMQGPNVANWDYGRYNELLLANPVVSHVPLVGGYFNIGPVGQSGSGTTVKQTTRIMGPSMRMGVELGDLDGSYLNVVAGESGHVLSRHYKDQWPAYYGATSFPMQFQKVKPAHTLTLRNR